MQRRVDPEAPLALHPRAGGQIGQALEGRDEFRPAVRIAGVVHAVDADKDVEGVQHLRPAQRDRQKNRVAGRHIGDGDLCFVQGVLGNADIVRQGAAANGAQIDIHNLVFRDAQELRMPLRLFQLDLVALPVTET